VDTEYFKTGWLLLLAEIMFLD